MLIEKFKKNIMNREWSERTELLLGAEGCEKIRNSSVLIVGVGGVGGYAAEMIARSGVGKITLIDADSVSVTNINRQIVALNSTVSKPKIEVMAQRIKDINPEAVVTTIFKFMQSEDFVTLLENNRYDYIVDAIDTLTPKIELIRVALEQNIPLVSSMGAGSKLDPTLVEVKDISKTHHCPLAHALRKRLHKIGIRKGFKAVFSSESPIEGSVILVNEQNKKSNVGTISYMPTVFGIACASVVIRALVDSDF